MKIVSFGLHQVFKSYNQLNTNFHEFLTMKLFTIFYVIEKFRQHINFK